VQVLKQNKILVKWENGEMGNWQNGKLEMGNWQNGETAKWEDTIIFSSCDPIYDRM
jgi:hypothetical protein